MICWSSWGQKREGSKEKEMATNIRSAWSASNLTRPEPWHSTFCSGRQLSGVPGTVRHQCTGLSRGWWVNQACPAAETVVKRHWDGWWKRHWDGWWMRHCDVNITQPVLLHITCTCSDIKWSTFWHEQNALQIAKINCRQCKMNEINNMRCR